jgi:hypothetical protein
VVFPVRETLDIATGHDEHAPRPASCGADDLRRLQSCVAWLNQESAKLAQGTARKRVARLPRATQLPPVPGLSNLVADAPTRPSTPASSPGQQPEAPLRAAAGLPCVLAPPLASDRLQASLPGGNYQPGAALLILAVTVVGGSIGYYIAPAGLFSTPEIAQAAALLTP